ncbi:MAG: thermopsin family protease, partial [Thermoplasmata archaeon]
MWRILLVTMVLLAGGLAVPAASALHPAVTPSGPVAPTIHPGARPTGPVASAIHPGARPSGPAAVDPTLGGSPGARPPVGRLPAIIPNPSLPPTPRPKSLPPAGSTVDPTAFYTAEPAPMGISDFGVNDSTGTAYAYDTDSFLGNATISNLTLYNSSMNSYWATLQLNVVLAFEDGGVSYAYWIQDVAVIDTYYAYVYYQDNVWNLSGPGAVVLASSLVGNGVVDPSIGFYYDLASANLSGSYAYLSLPSTISLQVNSALSASGEPEVTFGYDDGSGWQVFDQVIFTVATDPTSVVDDGFEVNGTGVNPTGYLYYDAELVLGGPGGGSSTEDFGSEVDLTLDYFNGANFQATPSAWDFGSNTAETVSNVDDLGYSWLSNGSLFAQITAGSGSLEELWDPSEVSETTFELGGVPAGQFRINTTAYGFSAGEATVVAYAGTYPCSVVVSGVTEALANQTLTAGTGRVVNFDLLERPTASLRASAIGTVTGDIVLTYAGSWPWPGARGELSLVVGALDGGIVASARLISGLNGNFTLNTSQYPDGNYSVTYEVTSPFAIVNLTATNFYFESHYLAEARTLAFAEGKISSLEANLTEANSTESGLRTELADANDTLAKLTDALSSLRAEFSTSNETIAQLDGALTQADLELADLRTNLSEANGTIDSLRAELAAENMTLADLTSEVTELTSENEANSTAAQSLRAEVANLTTRIATLEGLNSNLSVELSVLQQANTNLTNEVAELQAMPGGNSTASPAPGAWYDSNGGAPVYALAGSMLVLGVVVGLL